MQISNYVPVMVLEKSGHDTSALVVKLKMKVPVDMTMLQFVDRIRFRLKIPSFHTYHLLLEKGFAVMMSRNIGCVHQNNKDETGLLRLTCVLESTFGCIRPHPKRIRKLFPGSEPNPFGAPSPSFGFFTGVTSSDVVLPIEGPGEFSVTAYSDFIASLMGQDLPEPISPAPVSDIPWIYSSGATFALSPLNPIEGPQTVPNLSPPTINYVHSLQIPFTEPSLFPDHYPIPLSDTLIPYLNPSGGQQTEPQGPSPQIPLQNQVTSQQPVPRGPSSPVQFVSQVAIPRGPSPPMPFISPVTGHQAGPSPPMPFISPVSGHQAGPRGPSLPMPFTSQVGGQQTGPRAPLSKLSNLSPVGGPLGPSPPMPPLLNGVAGHQTGHTSAYQTVMNCLTSTDYLSQPESIDAALLASQEELSASQEAIIVSQAVLGLPMLSQDCSEEEDDDNCFFPPTEF